MLKTIQTIIVSLISIPLIWLGLGKNPSSLPKRNISPSVKVIITPTSIPTLIPTNIPPTTVIKPARVELQLLDYTMGMDSGQMCLATKEREITDMNTQVKDADSKIKECVKPKFEELRKQMADCYYVQCRSDRTCDQDKCVPFWDTEVKKIYDECEGPYRSLINQFSTEKHNFCISKAIYKGE